MYRGKTTKVHQENVQVKASGSVRVKEEYLEQVRAERNREAPRHQGWGGEEGEAKRFKKPKENVLDETQNTSCSSKRHPDDWTRAEERERRSTKGGEKTHRRSLIQKHFNRRLCEKIHLCCVVSHQVRILCDPATVHPTS